MNRKSLTALSLSLAVLLPTTLAFGKSHKHKTAPATPPSATTTTDTSTTGGKKHRRHHHHHSKKSKTGAAASQTGSGTDTGATPPK